MQGIFFEPPIEDNYLGHIMAEVYKDRVYSSILDGKKDLTILDIGANIGITAHYFSQFAKKVVAVEPYPAHFVCLSKMIEFNKLDNVVAVNRAIFLKEGVFHLYENKNKTMNSLHMAVSNQQMGGTGNSIPVQAITLKQLMDENKIEDVDLMKLDIEGSEIEVFSSLSFKEVAPRIKTIVTEVHAWAGRNPNQLNEALKNNGYTVEKLPNDASLIIARR